ncbi:hypothetical protein RFI_16766, partial [Reticulomyxa filosa]
VEKLSKHKKQYLCTEMTLIILREIGEYSLDEVYQISMNRKKEIKQGLIDCHKNLIELWVKLMKGVCPNVFSPSGGNKEADRMLLIALLQCLPFFLRYFPFAAVTRAELLVALAQIVWCDVDKFCKTRSSSNPILHENSWFTLAMECLENYLNRKFTEISPFHADKETTEEKVLMQTWQKLILTALNLLRLSSQQKMSSNNELVRVLEVIARFLKLFHHFLQMNCYDTMKTEVRLSLFCCCFVFFFF